jgi:hypothetical protein
LISGPQALHEWHKQTMRCTLLTALLPLSLQALGSGTEGARPGMTGVPLVSGVWPDIPARAPDASTLEGATALCSIAMGLYHVGKLRKFLGTAETSHLLIS